MITESSLKGVLEITPVAVFDSRGYFLKFYNEELARKIGTPMEFAEDCESESSSGVLRGMHFQKRPHEQGKLVRVVTGSVRDVVVDLRTDSPTYKEWTAFELNEVNKKMLWIPEGFAHGFLALENNTKVQYKFTKPYNKECECGLIWNDPEVGIDWGITNPILSERDKMHPLLKNLGRVF